MVVNTLLCFVGCFLLAILISLLNYQSMLSEKRGLLKIYEECPNMRIKYKAKAGKSVLVLALTIVKPDNTKVLLFGDVERDYGDYIYLDDNKKFVNKDDKNATQFKIVDSRKVYKTSFQAEHMQFSYLSEKSFTKKQEVEVIENPAKYSFLILGYEPYPEQDQADNENIVFISENEPDIPDNIMRLINNREKIDDKTSIGFMNYIPDCILVGLLLTLVSQILIRVL